MRKRKMKGKIGTLFEPWELRGYKSLDEWKNALREQVVLSLLKQGFHIKFEFWGNTVVVSTSEEFKKIIEVCEKNGCKWWKFTSGLTPT